MQQSRRNDSKWELTNESANYLDTCRRYAEGGDDMAKAALPGIQSVLTGTRKTFTLEYPSHTPLGQEWYRMRVTSLKRPEGGALMLHCDVTDRKRDAATLRRREDDMCALTGRVFSAEENERRRVARELHDDFTQRLAFLTLEVGKIEQNVKPSLRPILQNLRNQIAQLSVDMHRLSRRLHPSILDDLGLIKAIEAEGHYLSQTEALDVTFVSRGIPDSLPQDTALSLYRIVQEGLRNISKHARTKKAYVSFVTRSGLIRLLIEDEGIGFDHEQIKGRGGLGLASMKERAQAIKGSITVTSEPGQGTSIEVQVPLTTEVT